MKKIGLLTSGADDYITKPFEIQEVLARIQVQLRHMQQEPEHKSVSYKNLELDRERFEVRIAGVLLPKITKQEFAILELLLEHPKQVFSKEEILNMRGMNTIWERQRHWMYISAISGKDKSSNAGGIY